VVVPTYRFDAQRGGLQPIQALPSIPASYTANNTGAEIAVAPSGRVVYASNRGHDSIAIFAVDRRDGTLTPAAENFFQGGSPKQATPFFPPGPPHRQKSFLTKFPGMGPG